MRSAPDAVVARYRSLTSALLLPPSIATLRSATQSASLVQQRVREAFIGAGKSRAERVLIDELERPARLCLATGTIAICRIAATTAVTNGRGEER